MSISLSIGRLREKGSAQTEASLSAWCESDKLSDEWFESNHEYSTRAIDIEICHCRNAGQFRKLFDAWHNVEIWVSHRNFMAQLLWPSRFACILQG